MHMVFDHTPNPLERLDRPRFLNEVNERRRERAHGVRVYFHSHVSSVSTHALVDTRIE